MAECAFWLVRQGEEKHEKEVGRRCVYPVFGGVVPPLAGDRVPAKRFGCFRFKGGKWKGYTGNNTQEKK